MPIGPANEDRPGDVPLYISDCARLFELTDWRPSRAPRDVLAEILAWVKENEAPVAASLGFGRSR